MEKARVDLMKASPRGRQPRHRGHSGTVTDFARSDKLRPARLLPENKPGDIVNSTNRKNRVDAFAPSACALVCRSALSKDDPSALMRFTRPNFRRCKIIKKELCWGRLGCGPDYHDRGSELLGLRRIKRRFVARRGLQASRRCRVAYVTSTSESGAANHQQYRAQRSSRACRGCKSSSPDIRRADVERRRRSFKMAAIVLMRAWRDAASPTLQV